MSCSSSYTDLLRRIDELENDAITVARLAASAGRKDDRRAAAVERRLAALIDAISHAHANLARTLRLNGTPTTRLVAEVGHDMMQPLAVIVATLEMLATRSEESQRPMIARAIAATGRMERAFIALIEKARLDSSMVTPAPKPFHLAPLFAELQNQHQEAARKKALELRVNQTDQRILTDPMLLGSILHNLVGNAIRYTDDGQVVINAIPRGAWCSIEVADTGVGIDETELSMIFGDFKQLASAPAPGIGLGLAIAKRTANVLGLRLAVSSTLGKGSRFSIEVPTVMNAEARHSA